MMTVTNLDVYIQVIEYISKKWFELYVLYKL